MAYSSIKVKKCKYNGCNLYPKFGARGFCWQHEEKENKAEKNLKSYQAKKEKNRLDFSVLITEDNFKTLTEWFAYHMENSERICDNCKADLSDYDYLAWHGSQHHVLEKADFPSVKTNILNHLVLGQWCCHSQWHTNYRNASKMEVFSEAQEIVIKLFPLLTPGEIKKLSVYYTLVQV